MLWGLTSGLGGLGGLFFTLYAREHSNNIAVLGRERLEVPLKVHLKATYRFRLGPRASVDIPW